MNETIPDLPSTTTPSLTSRLTDIVAAPGDLADQLKLTPPAASSWVMPLVLLVVTSWIGATLLFSQGWFWQQIHDTQGAAMEKSLKARNMSDQQIEQAKASAEKITDIVARIAGYAAPPIVGLVICFGWATYLWLVGTKALGGSFGFLKAVELTGLTLVIDTLGGIVKTLLIFVTGNIMASASPILLIHPFDPTNVIHNAAAQLELFSLWALALKSLFLARLSGRSFGTCAVWVFGFWILLHGLLVGLGALGQRLGGG
jgi:hypothetical protein